LITFGQRKKQTGNGTTHFPLIPLTRFHLFHSLCGALALAGNLGQPHHEHRQVRRGKAYIICEYFIIFCFVVIKSFVGDLIACQLSGGQVAART
jgi:hypothetical protein